MSRRYDELMTNRFEHHGVEYELIEPTNLETLVQALHVKDVISEAFSERLHDEDTGWLEDLSNDQSIYIQSYIDSLGTFDGSRLVANINAKAKQSGLRIGDLEEMLSLSAGYISRTGKENSGKRLGIDVVWKASRILEVGVGELVESDLSIREKDISLIYDFIRKLSNDTNDGAIDWINVGGTDTKLDPAYYTLGMFEVKEDGTEYRGPDYQEDKKYVVSRGGVRVFQYFTIAKDLMLVPYASKKDRDIRGYDFYLINSEGAKVVADLVVSTLGDANLNLQVDLLMVHIQENEAAFKLSPQVRSAIMDFLS